MGFNLETRGRCRSPDETEHHIEITKRLARPVQADMAEKPIFNGVPLGAGWWVMTQGSLGSLQRISHFAEQSCDGTIANLMPLLCKTPAEISGAATHPSLTAHWVTGDFF